jgi:hypothetical protein
MKILALFKKSLGAGAGSGPKLIPAAGALFKSLCQRLWSAENNSYPELGQSVHCPLALALNCAVLPENLRAQAFGYMLMQQFYDIHKINLLFRVGVFNSLGNGNFFGHDASGLLAPRRFGEAAV